MKNFLRAFFYSLVVFTFPLLASAHVVADSGSPTTPQPFSFYCEPYTDPFISGGEYVPTNNGTCFYTIPQTAPLKALAVYRGTPGNSTLVQFDFTIGSPASSLHTNPNSFAPATHGDNFFAAAFGATSGADLVAGDAYLQTGAGSPPAELSTLEWVWGPLPPDTTAPEITIFSPATGASYIQTDSIFIDVIITDAADSLITETTYLFNGISVDPLLPLPLQTAPLGLATLVVHATDEFGNTGHATSTFTIIEDTTPPSVVINNPIEGETYASNQNNVFASATITDEHSAIISTTYLFDSTPINPINPLPITSASFGPHTLTVSATDANNNTGSASVQFFVAPWDTGAPTITVHTPVQDGLYHKNQTVLIDTTITDPEGSSVVSTTHLFNDSLIDPLLPLPLAGAPVGTSILVVSATDEFGNIGYATTTFSVEEPSEETTTLSSTADTYVRNGAKNTNEGASPILRIQGAGDNRVLVRFDQNEIEDLVDGGILLSATLEFDIEDIKNNWGPLGREVAIHRLIADWAEGNGKNAELPGAPDRGSGSGATWDCAIDTDIANHKSDCTEINDWNMRLKKKGPFLAPWVETQTDGVFIERGQQGVVAYDVTTDVNSFLSGEPNYGWIVLKSLSFKPGYVTFHSKDAGNAHAPRLILNYIPGY